MKRRVSIRPEAQADIKETVSCMKAESPVWEFVSESKLEPQ